MLRLMQSFKQHFDLKNAERFSINEQSVEAICAGKDKRVSGEAGSGMI